MVMPRSELPPEPVTIMMPAGMKIVEKGEEAEPVLEPASPLPTKTKFETTRSLRYKDEGELGRGGMGTIRATRDKRMGRTVAAKVLQPDAAQAGRAMIFVEEAQITGQLEHPNIIPVYDMGVTPGSKEPYFTMKLVSGDTLEQLITEFHENNRDAEFLERLLRIMLQVCDTISYAHERGVIHRDIKPQNIMLGSHGQIYVMDWGVAVLDQGRLSRTRAGSRGPGPALAPRHRWRYAHRERISVPPAPEAGSRGPVAVPGPAHRERTGGGTLIERGYRCRRHHRLHGAGADSARLVAHRCTH